MSFLQGDLYNRNLQPMRGDSRLPQDQRQPRLTILTIQDPPAPDYNEDPNIDRPNTWTLPIPQMIY